MSTFTVNCLDSKAHFETVSFDNIEYNSVNDYSMTSIEELADNIKKNGLLHNIVLSKQKNGKYKILAGERRTRAIQLLVYRILSLFPQSHPLYLLHHETMLRYEHEAPDNHDI